MARLLFFLFSGLCSSLPGAEFAVGDALPAGGLMVRINDETRASLHVVDNTFRIYFVDEANALVEPPLAELALRWEEVTNQTNDGYTRLTRAEGPYLTSPRKVFPPYWYRVWLIDTRAEKEEERLLLINAVFRQE